MLLNKKLLLFGGKGGVGKTSCAAAMAIYAASQGKKVLVMSTDPAHSLSDSFGVEIDNKITNIKNNLDALEINASLLLDDYKKKYGELIKQIADEGTFFSKDEIGRFFDLSLPGMDELMALVKVIDILEEEKYDLLILDTAPTGHTIRLLELPDLLTSYVKVLAEMRMKHRVVVKMMAGRYVKDSADEFIDKMNNDILRIKSILKDKNKTNFIPVTIPEAMSVYETEKLVGVLESHSIPIEMLLINRVIEDNCDFCSSHRKDQDKYIKQINNKFSKYEIRQIPLFANEIREKSLELLSNIIFTDGYSMPAFKEKDLGGPIGKVQVNFSKLKIDDKREFLLFGGKGGVGKTTIASATALKLSKDKKVLIFSTDPAHSLSDSFGVPIGDKVTTIQNNLDALEINAYALLNKFKQQYKKEITSLFNSILQPTKKAGFHGTIDAPYDRKVMEDLFDLCPPGIDEIMALKTMMDLMEANEYDVYILDTAPSGHTIRLLEMPEIAEEWLSTLSDIVDNYPVSMEISDTLDEMLNTIRKVRKILASDKTEFIVVTIAEAMSVHETKDLIGMLKKLNVLNDYLVINKIIPDNKCNFCSTKRFEQEEYIKQLSEFGLKTVGIESFDKELRGLQDSDKLSEMLFE
jgi:arsenite/tail-anchored protein-transporting ATPase